MKKKSKVYFRMFLSYLCILAIPMILAMLLYYYTFQIIRSQAVQMNGNLLVMVKGELDQEIENLQKAASRLALDSRVQMASNVKEEFTADDQMNLYYIYKECQAAKLSEEFITDMFLVFNNTQKVVSARGGNMSDAMFYNIYYRSDELSFVQFREYMSQHHYGDILPIHTDDGREVFLYTMTSLKSNYGDQLSTICFEIDFEAVRKRLQNMKWSEMMDVMVLTDTNVTVCADESISGHYTWDYVRQELGNYQLVNELGEPYIVSVLGSEIAPWKYLSVMPVGQMEKEARKVRTVAVLGLFLCTITGIFISYYIAKKNYNPLQMLMDTFRQHGKVEIGEGENEYQWLNTQMDQFFKQHVDAERLLKKNQKNLKNYYLYQLLQGYYDGKPLDSIGLRIRGEYNLVVLFLPQGGRGSEVQDTKMIEENALQKFAVMNVFEEMCLEHFNVDMAELGERAAAVVSVPDEGREHLDVVKNLAENLQQMMEEAFGFECVILCGSVCAGWEGIHTSYLQAAKLEEYIHLLDAGLLIYDEVKDIEPQYDYPMEMEQKIINAVKLGESAQAWKVMEQVFSRNLQGSRVTANVYRCLVYGMVGTLLEGAGQGGYKEAARDLEFPDVNFSKMKTEEMQARFKELLEEICSRIRKLQKETAQDQTLSKKIQEYIQENYHDADLNISITSQHFDLTPAYLSSIYKKQTGGSLLEYINTVRITHASEFLEQGYSVVEVAQMSGFRDSGTFIRAFKKKMGVTPGQMKKKI